MDWTYKENLAKTKAELRQECFLMYSGTVAGSSIGMPGLNSIDCSVERYIYYLNIILFWWIIDNKCLQRYIYYLKWH
jgi:hypothetical protein